MGECCGAGEPKDPDIYEAQSLEELIRILNERRSTFNKEQQQIKDYIKDPSKEVDGIDVKGISLSILQMRIPYLNDLDITFSRAARTLANNPQLDVEDIKPLINNIVNKYVNVYDPNEELSESMNNFIEYVNEHKK